MKKIHYLFFTGILIITFACQNSNEDMASTPRESKDTTAIIEAEPDPIFEETPLIEYGENSEYWKTSSYYDHFKPADLDTIYIGNERAVKNPFDYFSEERNNVFVIIDSGRYVNADALWLSGNNIIIKGEEGVSLLIDQLYDNVMWVTGDNIVVDNLHMMHLMPGESEGQNCSGRVIGFDGADNVTIMNCDLNGCGLAGLHDNMGNGTIYVEHNYIHNNSLGAYTNIDGDVWQEEIPDHETFVFKGNRIENNGFDRIYESGDAYYEEDFHGEH
jgi:hypothetical protein